MERAKETLSDVVSCADEIIRDERLRADILAAVGHGAEAGDRVRRDVDAAGIANRLAEDKKLRKKLRATLDDLESAGERLRPKRRHRIRNAALIAVAAGVAATLLATGGRWLAGSSDMAPAETSV